MFSQPPVTYIEPVFRPPSEGLSLILQVTNGCSWNNCTFCEMYTAPQKKFAPKSEDKVLEEIKRCGQQLGQIRRVFLGDGDAMALSVRRLKTILEAIKEHLPSVTRVSAYCLPRNIKRKTVEELQELRDLGLSLIYIGAESGDDEVLEKINKGETFESTKDAILKAKAANIKSSVMIINGMGGKEYSKQHAIRSAELVNATQPDYVATLVLFFSHGKEKVEAGFGGTFTPLNTAELCEEMRTFIEHTKLEKSIFRSDHVSNHLVLKGVLGKDKQNMLDDIDDAIQHFKAHPEIQHQVTSF
ncbi:radical SAM protein [Cocleimonas flava]|uniref:Radical SAM family protein n=1 Tax=Cocleimonas flava TaxID=634765 RepID=A0A4R1F9X4_9GAMM|nr:radical SAM protein [Cocleimonas flava]TCJ88688.1 radical SAM family protein [Cocleimonas flava]